MKLIICYSSPYYYLYDEDTNECLLKSVIKDEVIKRKEDLENGGD